MLRRRAGRPGLLGTAARTAVVAGTATAVSGRVQRRQAGREADQEQAAMAEQQQAAAQQQATMDQEANRAAGDDTISKLKELASLKDAGVLTEQEFSAAKAKLLAS